MTFRNENSIFALYTENFSPTKSSIESSYNFSSSLPPPFPTTEVIGNYEINKLNAIGHGSYAQVYRGVCRENKDLLVACKVIREALQSVESCRRERDIMKTLTESNAPYIIKFLDYSESVNFFSLSSITHTSIVMEYAPKGSLDRWLKDEENIPLSKQIDIISGITCAVAFVHQHDIIHCDIKAENVLLDANFEPKLSDFGVAKIREVTLNDSPNIEGTFKFLAPELLLADSSNNELTDIFSLALTYWQIMARQNIPFSAITGLFDLVDAVAHQGRRESIPDEPRCPKKIAHLITWGWSHEPKNRPSARELLAYLQTNDEPSQWQTLAKESL